MSQGGCAMKTLPVAKVAKNLVEFTTPIILEQKANTRRCSMGSWRAMLMVFGIFEATSFTSARGKTVGYRSMVQS
jgi:hypothetical protein